MAQVHQNAERLNYIATELERLLVLARKHKHRSLIYFLEMAQKDARALAAKKELAQ